MACAASPPSDWSSRWSVAQLEANRHALYRARLQHLSYVGSPRTAQGVKLENQYLVHGNHVERLSNYPMDARLGASA